MQHKKWDAMNHTEGALKQELSESEIRHWKTAFKQFEKNVHRYLYWMIDGEAGPNGNSYDSNLSPLQNLKAVKQQTGEITNMKIREERMYSDDIPITRLKESGFSSWLNDEIERRETIPDSPTLSCHSSAIVQDRGRKEVQGRNGRQKSPQQTFRREKPHQKASRTLAL